MIKEFEARLKLFNVISPGDLFWAEEVAIRGAKDVYEAILEGARYLRHKDSNWLQNELSSLDLSGLQEELATSKCEFITPDDLDWPASLDDLSLPPIGLLIKGDRKALLGISNSISIVGSRQPSNYGIEITKQVSKKFINAGFSIVSGGAYGIDTAAHSSALANNGTTISVLAGGFNNLYPKENSQLFGKICERGLLISEVMPNIKSQPFRFLIRNRLIAAISKATVVVEAAYVSGSIRTARDAAEILRPVFAVPGPITSPLSDGCHRLIAERVAEIATSVDEILEMVLPLHLK
jgi:DNA processing protein